MLQQPADLSAATDLFKSTIDRAISRQLPIIDLINCATQLQSLKQNPLAVELYKTWIAHNSDHTLVHAVYLNYGVSLSDAGDRAGGGLSPGESRAASSPTCSAASIAARASSPADG